MQSNQIRLFTFGHARKPSLLHLAMESLGQTSTDQGVSVTRPLYAGLEKSNQMEPDNQSIYLSFDPFPVLGRLVSPPVEVPHTTMSFLFACLYFFASRNVA
jgi:hypothetical protein